VIVRVRPSVSLAFLSVTAALLVANDCRRWNRAAGGEEHAIERQEAVEAKIQEVLSLRARRQRVDETKRPEQDIVAQINAALAEVGIRSDRLRELEPVADASVAGSGENGLRYKRQSVSATLEELTPLELGRFLETWREKQAVWVPERIELYHVRNQPEPATLYSMRMVMSASYVSDEVPGSPQ